MLISTVLSFKPTVHSNGLIKNQGWHSFTNRIQRGENPLNFLWYRLDSVCYSSILFSVDRLLTKRAGRYAGLLPKKMAEVSRIPEP